MSSIVHERPGVYSSYDTSAVVFAGQAPKAVGVAAKAARGTVGTAVTATGYAAGVEAFGEDAALGMSTLLRLLFLNGASSVTAVRVADGGTLEDYQAVCQSFDQGVYEAISLEKTVGDRKVLGGPAPENVRAQAQRVLKMLKEFR